MQAGSVASKLARTEEAVRSHGDAESNQQSRVAIR